MSPPGDLIADKFGNPPEVLAPSFIEMGIVDVTVPVAVVGVVIAVEFIPLVVAAPAFTKPVVGMLVVVAPATITGAPETITGVPETPV